MSRLHRADLKTLWLLGDPVKHSMSPLIQNTALEFLDLPMVYIATPVKAEGFAAAVKGLVSLGAVGANVTVPHKQAAFRCCDRLTQRAQAMGAVNTLSFVGGEVLGDNTDGVGWLRGLEAEFSPSFGGLRALVIGAGGAARAVVSSLLDEGCGDIVVLNRRPQNARDMLNDLSATFATAADVSVQDLSSFPETVAGRDLVVQTTSVGLDGTSTPVTLPTYWAPDTLFSELIYGHVTPLMGAIRGLGGRTQDGLAMLCYQAAQSLAIWTQRPAEDIPADLMLKTALGRLAERS